MNASYLLDVVRVGEEHGQAVDAEAPPRGGRQAVLQGAAKVLVVRLRLVVAVALIGHLPYESLTLHEGKGWWVGVGRHSVRSCVMCPNGT